MGQALYADTTLLHRLLMFHAFVMSPHCSHVQSLSFDSPNFLIRCILRIHDTCVDVVLAASSYELRVLRS